MSQRTPLRQGHSATANNNNDGSNNDGSKELRGKSLLALRAAVLAFNTCGQAPIGGPWLEQPLERLADSVNTSALSTSGNSSNRWSIPMASRTSVAAKWTPAVVDMLVAVGLVRNRREAEDVSRSGHSPFQESIVHVAPGIVGLYDAHGRRLNSHEGLLLATQLRLVWVSLVPSRQLAGDLAPTKERADLTKLHRRVEVDRRNAVITVKPSLTGGETNADVADDPPVVYTLPLAYILDSEVTRGVWRISSPKIVLKVLNVKPHLHIPDLSAANTVSDSTHGEGQVSGDRRGVQWECDICEERNEGTIFKCSLCGAERLMDPGEREVSERRKSIDYSSELSPSFIWGSWEEDMLNRANGIVSVVSGLKLSFRGNTSPANTNTVIQKWGYEYNPKCDTPAWCATFVELSAIDITAGKIQSGKAQEALQEIQNKLLMGIDVDDNEIQSAFGSPAYGSPTGNSAAKGLTHIMNQMNTRSSTMNKELMGGFEDLQSLTSRMDMLVGLAEDIRNKVFNSKNSALMEIDETDKELADFRIFISQLQQFSITHELPGGASIVGNESVEEVTSLGNGILVPTRKLKKLSSSQVSTLRWILDVLLKLKRDIIICADLWCFVNKLSLSTVAYDESNSKKGYISPREFMKILDIIQDDIQFEGDDEDVSLLRRGGQEAGDFQSYHLEDTQTKKWVRRKLGGLANGVEVIHNAKYNNPEIYKRILSYCDHPELRGKLEANGDENLVTVDQFTGLESGDISPPHDTTIVDPSFGKPLTSTELSKIEGISTQLANEILLLCEKSGVVCRDATLHGTYYYKNAILLNPEA